MGANSKLFSYKGYDIPLPLVNLTGGGTNTWDMISEVHMQEYAAYCPIEPDHVVLEPGCGVGRDAISLTKVLSNKGQYIGFDIIKPSIEWCEANITSRYANFTFFYLDIQSQIHNPAGKRKTTQLQLPVKNRSVDRIVLHSVFTHMFEDDITHYLREFRRILKPNGRVMASFFVLDDESLALARAKAGDLLFDHHHGNGCFINDKDHPEGAVGYTPTALMRMLKHGGMMLDQDIHHGYWSGRSGVTDGQDIVVMKPGALLPIHKLRQALRRGH